MSKFKKSLCIILSAVMLIGMLIAAPITVSAGAPTYFYPGIAESDGYWYAWTWNDGEEGEWRTANTDDEYPGAEVFYGLNDNVVFVLMSEEQSELNDDSWGYTVHQSEDLTVDRESPCFTATKWGTYNEAWSAYNFDGVWSDEEEPSVVTEKMTNTLSVSTAESTAIKASALKKAKKTIKALSISGAQGTLKVTKVKSGTTSSIYSKISVNSKSGAITLKKGTYKEGSYKVKLKVTAAGNGSYSSKTVTAVFKFKIKGKDANPVYIKTKAQAKDFKVSALAASKKTVKVFTAKKAKGKVKFSLDKKKTSSAIRSHLTVNKKTGAVTINQGTYAAGTYTVKVKATAKGNANYKSKTVSASVKIRIANQFVQCSKCKGKGKIKCSTCEGGGKLYAAYTVTIYSYGRPAYTYRPTFTCSNCSGKGKVDCSKCYGTGKVVS